MFFLILEIVLGFYVILIDVNDFLMDVLILGLVLLSFSIVKIKLIKNI